MLNDFSASTTTPGLMAACADSFTPAWGDPSTWRIGSLRFWLSQDGGAHWVPIHPPSSDGDECEAGVFEGINSALTIRVSSYTYTSNPLDRHPIAWITYDRGATWQHEKSRSDALVNGTAVSITMRRHDILFGLYTADGEDAPAISTDGGATWTLIQPAQSQLQQQGWRVIDSFIPDYRNDLWWYRLLQTDGKPPMLERSTDDGASWSTVGPIGSETAGPPLLVTTPLAPGRLCAAKRFAETDHISLLSSADGGATWRAGAMPASIPKTTGETSDVKIGARGDCYQGYHYRSVQQSSGGTGELRYTFWRLAPSSNILQPIPLSNDGNLDGHFTYVPAGNGMHARLVAQARVTERSWAAVFSEPAGETDDGQLLWTPVP